MHTRSIVCPPPDRCSPRYETIPDALGFLLSIHRVQTTRRSGCHYLLCLHIRIVFSIHRLAQSYILQKYTDIAEWEKCAHTRRVESVDSDDVHVWKRAGTDIRSSSRCRSIETEPGDGLVCDVVEWYEPRKQYTLSRVFFGS